MDRRMGAFAVAVWLAVASALGGCAAKARVAEIELIVSAAASLTEALQAAQPAFEAQHPGVRLRWNFGSSGALEQQIEHGAPADLFLSAATGPMDALVEKGLVERGAVRTAAANVVVLIGSVKGWDDLAGPTVRRVALGNPAHVPAGQYGKAVLTKLNLWESVQPRLVLGEDVRQVLAYVESGEVDAGIVYKTDAASSKKVTVVAEAPAGSHPPVVYPMAVVRGSQHAAEARSFADFLLSPAGQAVLAQYGFKAP